MTKRESWSEEEVKALPLGEHDYFERKSGLLLDKNKGEFLMNLAKALSAFANSGGGHLILGVIDDGSFDGLLAVGGSKKSRTSIKDWLEQTIPSLLDYALSDFRVHTVQRSNPSSIPEGREVIVIDIGDSSLAPHQAREEKKYYYRSAGRSELAPHFYLELLRQRFVSPILKANEIDFTPIKSFRHQDKIFLSASLDFYIENTGRVAAYGWGINLVSIDSPFEECWKEHYCFDSKYMPPGSSNAIKVRMQNCILPGMSFREDQRFGVYLRPLQETTEEIQEEIERKISSVTLGYKVATESSPGECQFVRFCDIINAQELATFITNQLSIN